VNDLAMELHGAAHRGEIRAVYQPQIDLATNRIVSVETLSRWEHPVHGPIPPSEFIPLAETSDAIDEIGEFMLDRGAECAAILKGHGLSIEVSVNVSVQQLRSASVAEAISRNLAEHELEPSLLTIEITESTSVGSVAGAAERLLAIRELGIGLSIDDFGTGHSSVAQLLSMPATELKIDQSIVQRDDDAARQLIAEAVELCHAMGVRVVAEGVETVDHLERARELGCDRAQGYAIGRATSLSELEAMLLA
jgi:EAL domain-containing protein (putative c-di-GMP-specific phosphodiesterase class I)